jgi:L-lactate dehydrogenase (cytochrome)
VPVAGARLRDTRNGMTIPATLRTRTVLDGILHPAYWVDLLTTEPFRFASFESSGQSASELINSMFDPAITVADIDWLRSVWDGPIVVKGIQHVDDARTAVDAGAAGIVVSNHGGRQLDRAPVPLELLPAVVDAVGDRCEVLLDTGVRNGADIAAAVALGAQAVMVGRAYLYGLMAGGVDGVDRAAAILHDGLERTLRLLGVTSVDGLGPEHVRRRDRSGVTELTG